MTITGIICEYDPFHLGHAYQMAQARKAAGEDGAVVCVMSGAFVQRGGPAILNKYSRAEMGVRGGADLVLELPLPWSVSSAEGFAQGGVALLESVGAARISFGCEDPDIEKLRSLARALLSEDARELIKFELAAGVSYATARERAAQRLMGEDAEILRRPNNILAVEYLKAMERGGSRMTPVPVARFGPAHGGGEAGGLASASRIRELILSGRDVSGLMPEAAFEILRREMDAGRAPVSAEAMEGAVMYRLRTMTDAQFEALPDSGEGLWRRFARAARSAPTLEAVLYEAKTKRYALSRLRRMALWAYLGIGAGDMAGRPPYIRVLAIGERGRDVLRQVKASSALPIITKPASAKLLTGRAREIFELGARAEDLYSLLYPERTQRVGGADWTSTPAVV